MNRLAVEFAGPGALPLPLPPGGEGAVPGAGMAPLHPAASQRVTTKTSTQFKSRAALRFVSSFANGRLCM